MANVRHQDEDQVTSIMIISNVLDGLPREVSKYMQANNVKHRGGEPEQADTGYYAIDK